MRRLIGAIFGIVAVAAAAGALWTYLAERGGTPSLTLLEVVGDVQLLGASGQRPAEAGTELEVSDRIETQGASRAVLGIGRETRIRLGPTSSVVVESIEDDGVRLELEDGALHATVRPEAGAVRVSSRGTEVVATNNDFSVGVHEGILQAKADKGDLTIVGADITRVEEGKQATIVDRQAQVEQVPMELLLHVDWPTDIGRTRKKVSTVTGRTAPGAQVKAWRQGAGAPTEVRADATGAFEVDIELAEGPNELTVTSHGLLGETVDSKGKLETRDTLGTGFKAGVDYGN